jgi:hypothetical protein
MPSFLQTLSAPIVYGSLALLTLAVLVALVLLGIVFARQRRIRRSLETFFSGKDAQNLESILREQLENTKELDSEIQELFEISNRLRDLCLKSVHKTAVLRFNPFKEVGGNQSFSVALLDGKNSGAVLSSLHTREGTRVYAKPVVAGEPDGFPFTDEEKATITQAIQGKPPTV